MSSKKSIKKKKAVASKQPSPSLMWYRRIAVTFVVITFLTLAVVVYLSFSRATIHIVAAQLPVETTFVADVVDVATLENETEGRVVSSVFEQAKEVALEGQGTTVVEDKAGGSVTIYNDHSADQTLVATTRLLTPEGILFRIDETILVPAGGSVQVMAHADQVGVSGEIGPSSFTIPGLSESLQQKIYAKSAEPMTGGISYARIVTEGDLDEAASTLREEMLEAAKETLRLELDQTYSGEAFFDELITKRTDTTLGEEADSVSVSLSIKVVGVFFQEEDLMKLTEMKVYEDLGEGLDLVGFDSEDVSFEVARYDLENQLANINVNVNTTTTLAPTSDVLDLEAMLGRAPNEVKADLESSEMIESVDISFTPFWLQRLPTLKDHIKIVIE